ncbi:hypothetical protein EYF80_041382 [Liparis tanakae]|uniref:Uncharacterized protein n=1 Tax=Liparis tanakae TaxID=230148 RepID=A0A4Z2G498_9TELE|nr:hypothetical protein EYF80_041382 [Liparis tanakae]
MEQAAGAGSDVTAAERSVRRQPPSCVRVCARALCDSGRAFTQRGSGGHVARLKHKQRGNRRISPRGKLASGNTVLEARVDRGTVTRPNHDAERSLLKGPIALPTARRPSRRSLLLTSRLFSASACRDMPGAPRVEGDRRDPRALDNVARGVSEAGAQPPLTTGLLPGGCVL